MLYKRTRVLGIMMLLIVLILSACSTKEGAEAVFAIDDYEDDLAIYFLHMPSEDRKERKKIVLWKLVKREMCLNSEKI